MSTAPRDFVVAATGLLFEARIAERSKGVVAIAGGGVALERRLLQAAQQGARGIVSFGVAGALDPELSTGTIWIGSEIESQNERFTTDGKWLDAICTRLPDAQPVRVLASDTAITSSREKAALYQDTRCRIVDMESHVAGRVAAKLELPLAVIRVVSDTASRDLPPAALVGMRPDGRTDLPAVLRSLAVKPLQLPALIQLAADTGKARSALLRCVRLLGPGLGGIDLS